MSNWTVQNRVTGEVVHAYGADFPDHFESYPLDTFNHIKVIDVVDVPAREISGVAFLRRFTQAQRIAIRELAKVVPEVDDFMRLLDATIAQGGIVNLDDVDTVAGVNALAALLPDAGIVPAEILA